METLSIEWQRPIPRDLLGRPVWPQADMSPVAAAMRVNVATPEEASRVFNALGAVLRALTTDEAPPAPDRAGDGRATLDPRDG